MSEQSCFHCGLTIAKNEEINFDEKKFCCNGCKTVYEIFSLHDMTCYYDFDIVLNNKDLKYIPALLFLYNNKNCYV